MAEKKERCHFSIITILILFFLSMPFGMLELLHDEQTTNKIVGNGKFVLWK